MSNFLFILPEGWIQLDWDYVTTNVPNMTPGNIDYYIYSSQLIIIEEGLKLHELIPADSTVVDVKLFDNTYFAVLLG